MVFEISLRRQRQYNLFDPANHFEVRFLWIQKLMLQYTGTYSTTTASLLYSLYVLVQL